MRLRASAVNGAQAQVRRAGQRGHDPVRRVRHRQGVPNVPSRRGDGVLGALRDHRPPRLARLRRDVHVLGERGDLGEPLYGLLQAGASLQDGRMEARRVPDADGSAPRADRGEEGHALLPGDSGQRLCGVRGREQVVARQSEVHREKGQECRIPVHAPLLRRCYRNMARQPKRLLLRVGRR